MYVYIPDIFSALITKLGSHYSLLELFASFSQTRLDIICIFPWLVDNKELYHDGMKFFPWMVGAPRAGDHIMVQSANHPLPCGLQSAHHIPNTHTLSQRRRIKHACLMLRPALPIASSWRSPGSTGWHPSTISFSYSPWPLLVSRQMAQQSKSTWIISMEYQFFVTDPTNAIQNFSLSPQQPQQSQQRQSATSQAGRQARRQRVASVRGELWWLTRSLERTPTLRSLGSLGLRRRRGKFK